MFTLIEQQTLDIDWFFTNNKHVAFVASGGGKLPPSVAMSRDENGLLVSYFSDLPENNDVIINPGVQKIISSRIDERYLSYFVDMAKKGLFAFDRTVLNDFSNTDHHLVASPTKPLSLQRLAAGNIKDIR